MFFAVIAIIDTFSGNETVNWKRNRVIEWSKINSAKSKIRLGESGVWKFSKNVPEFETVRRRRESFWLVLQWVRRAGLSRTGNYSLDSRKWYRNPVACIMQKFNNSSRVMFLETE